jgi:hypothetical protein
MRPTTLLYRHGFWSRIRISALEVVQGDFFLWNVGSYSDFLPANLGRRQIDLSSPWRAQSDRHLGFIRKCPVRLLEKKASLVRCSVREKSEVAITLQRMHTNRTAGGRRWAGGRRMASSRSHDAARNLENAAATHAPSPPPTGGGSVAFPQPVCASSRNPQRTTSCA